MRFSKPNFKEISQYAHDLERMTKLRDHCMVEDAEEIARYDNIIKCMQLVLIKLNGGKYDKTTQ